MSYVRIVLLLAAVVLAAVFFAMSGRTPGLQPERGKDREIASQLAEPISERKGRLENPEQPRQAPEPTQNKSTTSSPSSERRETYWSSAELVPHRQAIEQELKTSESAEVRRQGLLKLRLVYDETQDQTIMELFRVSLKSDPAEEIRNAAAGYLLDAMDSRYLQDIAGAMTSDLSEDVRDTCVCVLGRAFDSKFVDKARIHAPDGEADAVTMGRVKLLRFQAYESLHRARSVESSAAVISRIDTMIERGRKVMESYK